MKGHPIPRGAWIVAATVVGALSLEPVAHAKKPPPDAPPAAAPATPAAGPAVATKAKGAEPEERVIEKKDGDYILRLTLRPGNLRTNHVANVQLDINKSLDIPDPVTGDLMPMTGSKPIATVKGPDGGKGHHG